MEKNKKNLILIITLVVICLMGVCTYCLIVRNNMNKDNKQEVDSNQNSESANSDYLKEEDYIQLIQNSLNGKSLEEKTISNSLIEELFKAVGGYQKKLTTYSVIDLEKDLLEYSDEEKLGLILEYGQITTYPFTKEIISDLSDEEQKALMQFIDYGSQYVTKEDMITYFHKVYGYNPIFEMDNLNYTEICPAYSYIESIDIYVQSDLCGGDSDYDWVTFIYDYQESNEKATIKTIVYDKNTVNRIDGFHLTDENIKYFNNIEYDFEINNFGNFVVKNIKIINEAM